MLFKMFELKLFELETTYTKSLNNLIFALSNLIFLIASRASSTITVTVTIESDEVGITSTFRRQLTLWIVPSWANFAN